MKVSLEWLKEYVRLPDTLTPAEIMHDLTLSTVEVEGVEYPAERLANVVVARVSEAEPVPDTKLSRTVVDAGASGTFKVVCGASNVRAGLTVALALPGAVIQPKGAGELLSVAAAEVRGMPSEAVICAANEIGLAGVFPDVGDDEIVELDELQAVEPGTPLAACVGYDDAIFEIDNKSLTNRPDLWGHYGIARELSAIYEAELAPLPERPEVPSANDLLSGSDPSVCNRFTATIFDGVEIRPAPLTMRSRLARVGQRSIDLFVDLTNYVMFVTGQPSHAYDADEVAQPMCARRAAANETVVLLDGSEIESHPNVPYIADAARPLAVAGVMGGEASGVTAKSTRIFLEMANFDARVVRASAQQIGARTEASSRFEKALDTQRIDQGLAVFHTLLNEIQPGIRATAFQDSVNAETERAEVTVSSSYIDSRLGIAFSPDAVRGALERLGFEGRFEASEYAVVAPTWRSTGDISLAADIVEEVARLHGYDNFQFVSPRVDLSHRPQIRRVPLDRRVRELLAGAGLQEVFTYPWTRDQAIDAAALSVTEFMSLEAPPAPEQSRLRPTLVPNLLEAVVANQRYFEHFGLFEVGAVYPGSGEVTSAAAVIVEDDVQVAFRKLRGVVEHLIRRGQVRGCDLQPVTDAHDWADPSAQLAVLLDGQRVGTLARVSNRSKRLTGVDRGELVAFELQLDEIDVFPTRENRYERLPEFPGSWFDVSVVVADDVTWADVVETISGIDPLLKTVQWVGEYRGRGVEDGSRSLTMRLVIGSDERTLVSSEAEAVRQAVVDRLAEKLSAILR